MEVIPRTRDSPYQVAVATKADTPAVCNRPLPTQLTSTSTSFTSDDDGLERSSRGSGSSESRQEGKGDECTSD